MTKYHQQTGLESLTFDELAERFRLAMGEPTPEHIDAALDPRAIACLVEHPDLDRIGVASTLMADAAIRWPARDLGGMAGRLAGALQTLPADPRREEALAQLLTVSMLDAVLSQADADPAAVAGVVRAIDGMPPGPRALTWQRMLADERALVAVEVCGDPRAMRDVLRTAARVDEGLAAGVRRVMLTPRALGAIGASGDAEAIRLAMEAVLAQAARDAATRDPQAAAEDGLWEGVRDDEGLDPWGEAIEPDVFEEASSVSSDRSEPAPDPAPALPDPEDQQDQIDRRDQQREPLAPEALRALPFGSEAGASLALLWTDEAIATIAASENAALIDQTLGRLGEMGFDRAGVARDRLLTADALAALGNGGHPDVLRNSLMQVRALTPERVREASPHLLTERAMATAAASDDADVMGDVLALLPHVPAARRAHLHGLLLTDGALAALADGDAESIARAAHAMEGWPAARQAAALPFLLTPLALARVFDSHRLDFIGVTALAAAHLPGPQQGEAVASLLTPAVLERMQTEGPAGAVGRVASALSASAPLSADRAVELAAFLSHDLLTGTLARSGDLEAISRVVGAIDLLPAGPDREARHGWMLEGGAIDRLQRGGHVGILSATAAVPHWREICADGGVATPVPGVQRARTPSPMG